MRSVAVGTRGVVAATGNEMFDIVNQNQALSPREGAVFGLI
jgi:hypothetical protein